jgi:hypothetical protein
LNGNWEWWRIFAPFAVRCASKRQKDLLDILRLVEAHPKLRKLLPADVAKKIKG